MSTPADPTPPPSPSGLALVTGGGGFVGSALVRALLARGDRVRVFARGDYPALREAGAETVRGDLRDPAAVAQACEGVDLVFHVAAKAGYFGDAAEYDAINIGGTEHVIAGCRAHGTTRLVYTSTPSVIADGGPKEGVDESAPYPTRHVADYPRTKAAAEALVMAADDSDAGSLRTVSLRPRGIRGPGDTQLFPRLVQWTREGKLRRIGTDDPLQDFAYIDNVVDAHLRAADRLRDAPGVVGGKTYFVSDGEPQGCWTMMGRTLETAGLPAPSRPVPVGLARFAGATIETVYSLFGIRSEPRLNRYKVAVLTQPCWFDITAARSDLGYVPAVSLEDGLTALRAWVDGGGLEAQGGAG